MLTLHSCTSDWHIDIRRDYFSTFYSPRTFLQQGKKSIAFWIFCPSQNLTDLFIEENIDNRVVDCRGLWEAGRYGRQSKIEWLPTVIHNPKSKGGIRQPAHQEANHHEDHHLGHLLLCFLGGDRLCLGLCCLLRKRGELGQTLAPVSCQKVIVCQKACLLVFTSTT